MGRREAGTRGEQIRVVSGDSYGLSSGRIVGTRFASIVFPKTVHAGLRDVQRSYRRSGSMS